MNAYVYARRFIAMVIMLIFVLAMIVGLIESVRASTLEVGRESVEKVAAVCTEREDAMALFDVGTSENIAAMNALYARTPDCDPRHVGYKLDKLVASGKLAGDQLYIRVWSVRDRAGAEYWAIVVTSFPDGN